VCLVTRRYKFFRALVLSSRFSCVGTKSAIRSEAYRIGLYDAMGSTGTTAELARDLLSFAEEQGALGDTFTTFVGNFVVRTLPTRRISSDC
jgi:FPC/CPF motif-containing protein YcgG